MLQPPKIANRMATAATLASRRNAYGCLLEHRKQLLPGLFIHPVVLNFVLIRHQRQHTGHDRRRCLDHSSQRFAFRKFGRPGGLCLSSREYAMTVVSRILTASRRASISAKIGKPRLLSLRPLGRARAKAGFNHPQNRKEPGDTVRWPFSTLVIALPTREDSNRAQAVPFRGDEPWKILE